MERKLLNKVNNFSNRKIEQAKRCIFKACVDLKVRLIFLKTCIWSTTLYECETRTIGNLERKGQKETFEMW